MDRLRIDIRCEVEDGCVSVGATLIGTIQDTRDARDVLNAIDYAADSAAVTIAYQLECQLAELLDELENGDGTSVPVSS